MQKLSLDIKKTKAILIGVSDYEHLDPIKPAMGNIDDLYELLVNEQLLGLPPGNIKMICNKKNDEIEDEIIEFLQADENASFETLLFYYVGHGIRENAANKELYLTGTNTKKRALKTSSIAFHSIKEHLEKSHWQQRIVIIDSCHSGLAALGEAELCFTDAELDIKGTYVLTSAGDEKSFFDTEERNTVFSGELIKLLRTGLPKHQACLSLEDIFAHLQKNVKQSTPNRKSNLGARDFFVFRNLQFDEVASLVHKAKQFFDAGEYSDAIKTYRDALAEIVVSGDSDQKRMVQIKSEIALATQYLEVKNALLPSLKKIFDSEIADLQAQISELEKTKSRLELKLKETKPLADYEALKAQKLAIEAALAKEKQELQKAWDKIAALEQANKRLQTEQHALEKLNDQLRKENEALSQDLKGALSPPMQQNFAEKIGDLTFDLIFIEGGLFQMGSNDEDHEKPIHEVRLSDYYMGKCPVTVAEFEQFVKAKNYQTDADKDGGSNIWDGSNWNKKQGVNWKCGVDGKARPRSDYRHPVIHVSWNDAMAYCTWLLEQTGKKYTLATEAQWEYAAGGGKGARTKWAGTNKEEALKDYAWYHKNSEGKTHEVALLAPNSLGLYDLSGNVWEWCHDQYGEKYYEECKAKGTVENPTGPESGSFRVIRGGSWIISAGYCRTACRLRDNPGYRSNRVGFRLVFVP